MIADKRTRRTDLSLSVLLILISGIGILIWNCFNPAGMDDFYFRTVMEDSDEERFSWCFGRKIETMADALYSAWHVFLYDSGRWTNELHILFQPFPDIVERIFSGIILTADIYLVAALASKSYRPKALVTVLVIAGFWIALPWYDNFYSLSFQANYIWPTAVMAIYMLILPGIGQLRGVTWWLFLLLCIFSGEGHEAFAVCAGAYTAGLLPGAPKAARRSLITAILFIFIGFCINLWAGTWHRYFDVELGREPFMASLPFLVSRMASASWPLWTALLLFTVRAATAPHKRKQLLKDNLPYIAAIAANMVIVLAVKGLGRTSWPGIIMAVLLVINLVRPLTARVSYRATAAISLVFACVYALWFVELIKWQKKIYEENAVLTANVERLGSSPTQVYPGPYTPSEAVPFYLMGIVNNPIDDAATRRSLAASVKPKVQSPMIVAVTASMDGPYDEWPLVEGNASVRGVWPMIATTDSTSTRLRVTFGTDTRRLSPLNRLISRIKDGSNAAAPVLDLAFRRDTVTLPDRTRVFAIMPEPLPRTVKGREVLRIDTIPLQ